MKATPVITRREVIRDGMRALLARDRVVKAWLLRHVAAAYDAIKDDPSRAGHRGNTCCILIVNGAAGFITNPTKCSFASLAEATATRLPL